MLATLGVVGAFEPALFGDVEVLFFPAAFAATAVGAEVALLVLVPDWF